MKCGEVATLNRVQGIFTEKVTFEGRLEDNKETHIGISVK